MNQNTKTILLVALVIILGGVAFFSTKETTESVDGPLRNFAIADTSAISKFKISDTEGNEITITRENKTKTWMVEGSSFKAKPENANLILDALKRIVIRQDLDEAEVNTTLNFLAVRHKKVEFFINNETTPVKSWYIGNSTADHQGTYMLLQERAQKSSVPFIVYKPGMRGNLEPRFFTSFVDWRFSGIYNYSVGAIKEIIFSNIDEPNESFGIQVLKDSKVQLLDGNQQIIPAFDTAQVSHYVTHFKKLHFSHVVEDLTEAQIDSVLNTKPNVTIAVTDKDNATQKVNIWKIFDTIETAEGPQKKLNIGYAFLAVDGSKELVRVQYYQWDNVLKPKSYFIPKAK
ncbi:MAG: hypothetical protein N4A35_05225 [Flavobacteriales bacterium]|jgi:hypothetical protein|nr:hypothetical protein [Flavobacteriales bacterium]